MTEDQATELLAALGRIERVLDKLELLATITMLAVVLGVVVGAYAMLG